MWSVHPIEWITYCESLSIRSSGPSARTGSDVPHHEQSAVFDSTAFRCSSSSASGNEEAQHEQGQPSGGLLRLRARVVRGKTVFLPGFADGHFSPSAAIFRLMLSFGIEASVHLYILTVECDSNGTRPRRAGERQSPAAWNRSSRRCNFVRRRARNDDVRPGCRGRGTIHHRRDGCLRPNPRYRLDVSRRCDSADFGTEGISG